MAENNTAKFKAQDENGGMGRERERERVRESPANLREMATTSKTVGRIGDLFHGVWGVYERQKWPPCVSLPKLPRGEMLEKYNFLTQPSQGGEGENGENKKEDEKLWAALKKEG